MSKKPYRSIYILNIVTVIILIIINMIIHSYKHLVIQEGSDGFKTYVLEYTYGEYFELVILLSLVVLSIVFFISMIALSIYQKRVEKRIEEFASLFPQGELLEIPESNAKSKEETIILRAWNESIGEIACLRKRQSDYFNSMIHDFKMPIQLTKSNIELYNLMNEHNKHVDKIEVQIDKLQSEINRVLILDKIEYFEHADLTEVDIIEMVKNSVRHINNIDVELQLNIDAVKIQTDVNMFNKILMNLLDNAIKYSIDEKVSISINMRRLMISNKCNPSESYYHTYDIERFESKSGNGLGNQIIAKYVEKLNLNIASQAKDGKFVTIIEF